MRVSNSFSYIAPVSAQATSTLTRQPAHLSEPTLADSVTSVSANLNQARAARVAELKKQYQAGGYRVELEEVSSKMIEKHLDR